VNPHFSDRLRNQIRHIYQVPELLLHGFFYPDSIFKTVYPINVWLLGDNGDRYSVYGFRFYNSPRSLRLSLEWGILNGMSGKPASKIISD
jgi:hypothetical protein